MALLLSALWTNAAELSSLEFRDRATGKMLSLNHWAGEVVVLDFFAYWCAPCRPASAKIEAGLVPQYEAASNPHGVDVSILAVNVESAKPAKTEKFISDLGLSHVVDDPDGQVLEALKARGHFGAIQHH